MPSYELKSETFTPTEEVFSDAEEERMGHWMDNGHPITRAEAEALIRSERPTVALAELAVSTVIQAPNPKQSRHRRGGSPGRISDADSAQDPHWNVDTGAIVTQEQSDAIASISADAHRASEARLIAGGMSEIQARAIMRAREEKRRQ